MEKAIPASQRHDPVQHALEAAEAGCQRSNTALRRVALRVSQALGKRLGGQCDLVGSQSDRRDAFDSLITDAADIAAITLEPVHVPALFIAPAQVAARLVEQRYGGATLSSANETARPRRGHAEAREFVRLSELTADALREGCEDRVPVTGTRLATLDAAAAKELISAGEAVGALEMQWQLPGLTGNAHRLFILLPLAALRAGSILQASLSERDPAEALHWKRQLNSSVRNIAMPARSVIARPTLSMAQLLSLRAGDVIPIGMPRQVPLLVADKRVATGTIGERDGRVAFQVTALEAEVRP